jgi:hypothetical protein
MSDFAHRSSLAVVLALAPLVATPLVGCGSADGPKPRSPTPVTAREEASNQPPAQQAPAAPTQAAAAPAATPPAAPAAAPAAPTKTSTADSDPALIEVAGIAAPKPATWTWQAPTMQFRTLQYAVPGEGDSTTSAELVVSVFAGNDGGPIESNITRWAGQFRTAEGGPATPKREEKEIDGMKVILVELAGAYMAMGAAGPRPDTLQLAAIIRAPNNNIFIRLVGPSKTVEANREAWNALVAGLKRAG